MKASRAGKPSQFTAGLALALGLTWSPLSRAQAEADTGAAPDDASAKLPPYHDTFFFWDHTVSAETIGIGNDVQSKNPTYVMGLGTKARWYLQDEPSRKLSLRANLGVYREFTDSDSTTQRGELTPSDTELALAYGRRLYGQSNAAALLLDLRLPNLILPTSPASFNSGRYFGVGVVVGLTHTTPLLRGRFEPELHSTLSLGVGYKRWFARATVPTQPSLELERMTPDGRSVPSDQLTGSSFIRDELTVVARWSLAFGEHVTWTSDFGLQPAWKYAVDEQIEVCGVIATGCATVEVGEDDSRYVLRTQVNTELSFLIVKSLSFDVGYNNMSNQLGPDGRRRGIFYSPDAVFYAALSFTPHELATPPKRTAHASAASTAF